MATLSASDTELKDIRTDLQRLRADLDELFGHAGLATRAQLDDVASRVRARPATSILIALGGGYLLGRLIG